MNGSPLKRTISILFVLGMAKVSWCESWGSIPFIENPLAGSRVFSEKRCLECHVVRGIGEAFGPDLTQIGQKMDFFELAGALWSHSPRMIEVMMGKNIPRPILSPSEIEELFSFLYFLGSFEESGDHNKGDEIFSRKGCRQCHSLGKTKNDPLDKVGRYVSPIYIATELWNHSPTISPSMRSPSFAPMEMSHLLAYIRAESWNPSGEVLYLQPGNPRQGQEVFREKHCSVCHGEAGQGLKQSHLRKGLTEIVGLMWNHSYKMWEEMKRRGLKIPRFTTEEMADLVTFLYFLPLYGERGDAKKGEQAFISKGCASCHIQDATEKNKGIDLGEASHLTIFELVSAAWNHVPEMERMTTELGLLWPRFEKDELKNLLSYIQSLKRRTMRGGNPPRSEREGDD
ncbi:MAG: hypothetical protein A2W03_10075 [Candidatus Aminicenantes bacterium RBG_16_63_16]|nr:MAG: hypothetical protein A2W03_10075 [Candidatus Aminicenantes bacterium RBG_16_63_16]